MNCRCLELWTLWTTKSLLFFTGVEKKNDDLRRYFHRKINRWDAATNVLLVEKRQEVLRDMQRTKRPYEKKKTSFWLEGGKEESARKVARISTTEPPQKAIQPEHPVEDTMTETELRKKKVAELITLFEKKTGKSFHKKTRKQEIIDALLNFSSRSE